MICGLGLPQSKILSIPMNWRSPEKLFWRLFFWRTLVAVSLVLGLGLEHSCLWPGEGLSSERLFLASGYFCVLGLGLEPCVLASTSEYWACCISTALTWLIPFEEKNKTRWQCQANSMTIFNNIQVILRWGWLFLYLYKLLFFSNFLCSWILLENKVS